MTRYEEVFQQAEDDRNSWKCRKAIKGYTYAEQLAMNDDEECRALHMKGVTYKMMGKLKRAKELLRAAAYIADGEGRLQNIYRDLADVLSLMGDSEAKDYIDRSLAYFDRGTREWYMGRGFEGRINQRLGNLPYALECYQEADRNLEDEQKLFNLVYYTNALLQDGKSVLYDAWWEDAFELCDEHGAWSHRLRLNALRYGGYRADNLVQKLLPLRRFTPTR